MLSHLKKQKTSASKNLINPKDDLKVYPDHRYKLMLDISKNGIEETVSPKKHPSRKMSIVIPYSSEDFLWFNTIYVWEIISDSGEDTRLDNQVIKCPKYEPLQIQESTNRICVNQIFSPIKCFSQSNAFNVKIAFKFLIKYSSSVLFISPPLPLYKCCQNIKKIRFYQFSFFWENSLQFHAGSVW